MKKIGSYTITPKVELEPPYNNTDYYTTNNTLGALEFEVKAYPVTVECAPVNDITLTYQEAGYQLSNVLKTTVKVGESELTAGTDYAVTYRDADDSEIITACKEYLIKPIVTLQDKYATKDDNGAPVYELPQTLPQVKLTIKPQVLKATDKSEKNAVPYKAEDYALTDIFPVEVTAGETKLALVSDQTEDGYMLSYSVFDTINNTLVDEVKAAGKYEITATVQLAGKYTNGSYSFSDSEKITEYSIEKDFEVKKYLVKVEYAENQNVTYNGKDYELSDYIKPKLTFYNPITNEEIEQPNDCNARVTYKLNDKEVTSINDAGTYAITVEVNLGNTDKYELDANDAQGTSQITVEKCPINITYEPVEEEIYKKDTSHLKENLVNITVEVGGEKTENYSGLVKFNYTLKDKAGNTVQEAHDAQTYTLNVTATLEDSENYTFKTEKGEVKEVSFNVDFTIMPRVLTLKAYALNDENSNSRSVTYEEGAKHTMTDYFGATLTDNDNNGNEVTDYVVDYGSDVELTAEHGQAKTYTRTASVTKAYGEEIRNNYKINTCELLFVVEPKEVRVEVSAEKTEFVYRPEGYTLTEYFPVTVKFTKEDGREETLTRDAENGYTLTYDFINSPAVETKDEKLTDRGTYQIRPTVKLTGKYATEYATGEKGNYSIQQIKEPTEFTVKPREVSVTYPVSQTQFKYRVSGYELKDILLVQVDILDDEGKSAIQTLGQENGDYTVEYVYTYTNQKKEEIEKNDKTVIDDAGIYKTTTHVKLVGQNNEYASTNKDGECNYVFKGTKQNVSKNDVDLTVNPYELSWSVEANGEITTGKNQFAYRSAKATGEAAGIPMSDALMVNITGFDGAGVTEAPECTIEYEITYDEDGATIGEEVWKQAAEALMVDAREYHVAIRANLSEPEDQNNYTIEKTTIDLEVVKRQVQATQYYKVNGEKSETAEKLWYRPGENGAHEIAEYIGVVVKTVPFNNDELDKYYGDYNLDMVNAEEVEEYTDTYSVKYDYVGKEPEDPESIQNAGDYVIHEEFEYNTQNYALDNKSKDENGDGTLTLTVQPRVIEVSHTSTGFVYNQKERALADQITLSAKSVQIEGYPEAYYPEVTMDDAAFKAIIAQLTYLAEGQDTFGQDLLDEEGNVEQFTAIEEAGTYEAWEEITLSDPNYELVNKTKENRTTIRVDKAIIRSADNEATKEIVYNGQDRLLNAGESELTSEKIVASAEGCENRVPASEYRLISDRTLNTIGEYTLSLQLTEECNNYRLADGGVSVKQYVLPHPVATLALAGGVNSDERGVYLFGGENPGVNHAMTLTGEPGESVDIILTNGTETLCETSLVFDGTRFANGDAKAAQTVSLSFQFADTVENGAVLTIGDKRIAIANNGRYELRVNYTDEENLTEQAAGQDAPKPESVTMGYMWDKTKPEVSLQSELHNRDRQTTVIVSEACTLESFKVNDVDRITDSDMEFGAQGEREYTLTWSMDTLMHSGTDALTIQSVDLVGNTNTQTFDVERSEGAPLTLTIQPVVNDNGYVDRSEVQVDYVAIFVEGTAGELIQIEQNGAMMTSTAGIKLPMLSRSGTEWAVDKMGGYSGQYSPDSFPNFEQFLLSTCYEDLDAPQADITLIYDDVCLPTVVASAVTEDCRVISCLAERGAYLSFYRNGEPINVQGRIDNYGVFVGSMPYLEKDDVLRIIAVDLAGNINRKEIVVGEEVSSATLDGYLMGRTAIGYVSGNEEMDWVTASYLRIDELREGVTLPLVAANAFIYGEAEVRMDKDGRISVETVLNDGAKAENDYVGVLTEYDMDSFKNKKAGSVVTNPDKIRDGVWVCFSQSVELNAAQMTESYLIWRDTSDEDYLLYLNRQRSAELSTLIF